LLSPAATSFGSLSVLRHGQPGARLREEWTTENPVSAPTTGHQSRADIVTEILGCFFSHAEENGCSVNIL